MDLSTINFKKWIDENRHLLKPPVGNKMIWKNREFLVMVVGGPNQRTDYHINEGEEFFYQVEGDMVLKIIDENTKPRDIKINEGEIYLLPPRIPHSPQRLAQTVGLVIERQRKPHELDGFAWFCPQCGKKLFEEKVFLTDIVKQLPPIFDKFYSSQDHTTCKTCKIEIKKPV